MRKISLLLAIVMVFSIFATCISAAEVSHELPLVTTEPEIDGVIDEEEWDDALAIDAVQDDSLYYYSNLGSQTNGCINKEIGEPLGYVFLGESTIYVKTNKDGIYLAFDIADKTVGNSYFKTSGSGSKYCAHAGDGVSVTFKPDQGEVSASDTDVVRISFSPFADQFENKRNIKLEVYEDHSYAGDQNAVVVLTDIVEAAATADNNGYVVETFIEWETLDDLGFEVPEYKDGNELNVNFAIHDAHNSRNGSVGTFWGCYDVPVNGGYAMQYDNGQADGFKLKDWAGDSYIAYAANTGDVIKFTAPKATITFDSNNGTPLYPIEATVGDEIDLSDYPTRKNGLTFVGWCTDEELTNVVKTLTVEENTTLYAKFSNDLTGTVLTKNATAPDTLDGEITKGEYDGAYVYYFDGNDMVYYGNNAARNWFAAMDKEQIEARGSKMIGESKIYVLPTSNGVYFAFDIADETPGANYVRDYKWHNGVLRGDSVSVIFKSSNDAVTVADYAAGDAMRISVAPFKNDFMGSRSANIVSCISTDYTDGVVNAVDTSFLLEEGATGDSTGYTVEFFVSWELLEDSGFTGLTEWKSGEKLYLDFQIVDALGPTVGGTYNGQPDYGVFVVPVDGSVRYDELNDYTEPSILGFIPYDKYNYYEFDANEGHTITLADAFEDVKQGEYYVKPIYWAMSKGITNGTSATTFEPNSYCTRGQIVTFIWRSKGCPEPTTTTNNFVDVKAGEYYVKAVLWAVENGITDGVDATHFDPNGICTRAQAVTFMYRAAGKPYVKTQNKFVDIPAGEWFTEAVAWASGLGITNGTDDTHFSPDDYCTRGQIVTFLYRNAAFSITSGAVI